MRLVYEFPGDDHACVSLEVGPTNTLCDAYKRLNYLVRRCTTRADHLAGWWYCEETTR